MLISLGLDGWGYLDTPADPVKRLVLDHLIARVDEMRDQHNQDLAVHIVNTYGKALG